MELPLTVQNASRIIAEFLTTSGQEALKIEFIVTNGPQEGEVFTSISFYARKDISDTVVDMALKALFLLKEMEKR